MFVIQTISDVVRVPPSNFALSDSQALTEQIELKYVSQFLMEIGQCISVLDILKIGIATIHSADGGAHFEVVFRLVVFQPFVGEVIRGKVSQCTKEEIKVTLGFFDNIKIPEYCIFLPNHFDNENKRWVWDDAANDEGDENDAEDEDEEGEDEEGEDEGEEGEGGGKKEEEEVVPLEELDISEGDEILFAVESISFTKFDYSAKGVEKTESNNTKGPISAAMAAASAIAGDDAYLLTNAVNVTVDEDEGLLGENDFAPAANAIGGAGGNYDYDADGQEGPPSKRQRSTSFDYTNSMKEKINNTKVGNKCIMQIVGTVKKDGLGKSHWWDEEEDDDDDDEDEEEEEEEECG